MFGDASFSEVVNEIYSASLEPARWPRALSALHRVMGGSTVTSLAYVERLGQGGLGFTNAEYTDPGWHWQSIQAMEPRCPRFRHAVLNFRPGALLFDAQHGHDGALGDADPCYQWYERELDARFYIAGTLFQAAGRHAYVAVQRSRRTGHVDKIDIRRLRELLPHLSRAVAINHALGEASVSRFEPEALAAIPQAAAALDADTAVLHGNEAFETLLRSDDGLVLRQGRLHARRPRDDRALQQLLAKAAIGQLSGALSLPRPSGRRAYGLVATPIPRGEPYFMARRPAAMLFAIDPELRPRHAPTAEMLAQAFDLTPMQARIAQLLGTGSSLDDCAAQLGVSRNTVRTHARAVYRRLQIERQSDLVALLAAWPPVAAG